MEGCNIEVGWLSCSDEEFYTRPYESNLLFTKEMLEGCPPMSPEMVEQLKILEAMGDEDIDCSGISETSEEQWRSAKRMRPWLYETCEKNRQWLKTHSTEEERVRAFSEMELKRAQDPEIYFGFKRNQQKWIK